MSTVRASVLHLLIALALGTVFVAAILPINLAALFIWAIVVVGGWPRHWERTRVRRSGAVVLATQLVTMSLLVLAAAFAPVKVVDRLKARRFSLPARAMLIAELEEVENRPINFHVNASDKLAGRVVRFPSIDPTVGEFIAKIEAQTPLRHGFSHCGNGSTILWGGDCSFGLHFREPDRKGDR